MVKNRNDEILYRVHDFLFQDETSAIASARRSTEVEIHCLDHLFPNLCGNGKTKMLNKAISKM